MYVRIVTVKRNGQEFRYPQLVESYRRKKDGVPVHRVLMGLSKFTPLEIENIKRACAASKQNKTVLLPEESVSDHKQIVLANLSYLPDAVAWGLWLESGVSQILNELISDNFSDVSMADVVGIMVTQRCVAPGSKLYTQQRYPLTALSELLGISPQKINGSRIHRVLSLIDKIDYEVQKRLPYKYLGNGGFASLFLDITDTWFEGRGPDIAEYGKTKEGLYKRKIGIILLCNEDGLPLRWKVIAGRTHDSKSMTEMINDLNGVDWLREVPFVCDRAMGKTEQIKTLVKSGMHFITALTKSEFESYIDKIPEQIEGLKITGKKDSLDNEIRLACSAAEKAGMEVVLPNLYMSDLNIISKKSWQKEPSEIDNQNIENIEDKTALAMKEALELQKLLTSKEAKSLRRAAQYRGMSKTQAQRLLSLLRLSSDIQEDIIKGRASCVSLRQLRDISEIADKKKQMAEFESLINQAIKQPDGRRKNRPDVSAVSTERDESLPVRAVLYFNPEILIYQRREAEETKREFFDFIDELRVRVSKPNCRRTKESVSAEIDRTLRRQSLLEVFEVKVDTYKAEHKSRIRIEIKFKEEEWKRRRRYDGFSLLVAHPDIKADAKEICLLYRAKDKVEKDFYNIKSVLQLRPVWHHNDAKVRAHVTICILALLVERLLEKKISNHSRVPKTAEAVFETLMPIHLNRLKTVNSSSPIYTITQANKEQLHILKALELTHLVDDNKMVNCLIPR